MRLSTHHCMLKYPLDLQEIGDGVFTSTVEMPSWAYIRHMDIQNTAITLWAQTDKEIVGRQNRNFLVVGTGREFDACRWDTYIGTVRDGHFVWHVYEEKT